MLPFFILCPYRMLLRPTKIPWLSKIQVMDPPTPSFP